jgi:two-component system chemotaxis response regulator CheY
MKVLLIDDSNTMRKIQKRTLGQMGVDPSDVSEAQNGVEALKILDEKQYGFDIILCDINMPEMNGLETVSAIRANPLGKTVPVIMCTSVAEKGTVVEAVKAGATNYLVKPFSPDDLKDKVEKALA